MKFDIQPKLDSRKKADILLLPFWKGKKGPEPAASFTSMKALYDHVLKTSDFAGKEGEVLILYGQKQPETRIALVGLGKKESANTEHLRRAYGAVARFCRPKKIKTINLLLPNSSNPRDTVKGIAEGLLLTNYVFNDLKHHSLKDNKDVLIEQVNLIGHGHDLLSEAKHAVKVCEAVYKVRDLVNGNADDVTPQYLVDVALALAKKYPKLKATVFDKKRITKEKMGLLLAVNRGSFRDPAFIILEYKGNPTSKDHTVLVGKGITFDTGGLNLKLGTGMDTMKCDMAGAAAVLGVLQAIAELGLKINVTGVIASTENSIGSKSFKPADVYKGYSGKTVEIGNTDAEGRLILADALSYSVENLKPSRIIDLATLTGSVEVALGNENAGLLSNNDALASKIFESGERTFERVWRLPLHEEYKDQLKSDIADIKSTGSRSGGCITATFFLKEFVGDTPWAHLDIAGTAFLSENKRYLPKFGTGFGVRLLVDFLSHLKT